MIKNFRRNAFPQVHVDVDRMSLPCTDFRLVIIELIAFLVVRSNYLEQFLHGIAMVLYQVTHLPVSVCVERIGLVMPQKV